MKSFEPFSVILPVLKDGAHSSGEDDKGAETVDVFKNKKHGEAFNVISRLKKCIEESLT